MLSTVFLSANPDKSCSGTVTELLDPEIVIVLLLIDRVCLSLSGRLSKVLSLPSILATLPWSVFIWLSSVLGKYLPSAVDVVM